MPHPIFPGAFGANPAPAFTQFTRMLVDPPRPGTPVPAPAADMLRPERVESSVTREMSKALKESMAATFTLNMTVAPVVATAMVAGSTKRQLARGAAQELVVARALGKYGNAKSVDM